MTLDQILKKWRKGLDDELGKDTKKNWQDWEGADYATRAVREIVKELMCLTSDEDITETLATGTVTLSGVAGSIASVSVNGVVVTSAAVPFNTSPDQTATDLAANITAYAASEDNDNDILFTATASGSVVTITSPSGTGSTPNRYVIAVSASGGMSATTVAMSGGACLCRLFLIPGQATYYLHDKTILLTRVKPGLSTNPLLPVTKKKLDATMPGWEDSDDGTPIGYIPDYVGKKIRLVPPPDTADTVYLDLVRFPYLEFDETLLDATPEISEDYQDAILPWMKRESFLKNDIETLDINRSNKFETEFYRMIEQMKTKLDINRAPAESGYAPYGMY